MLSLAAQRCRGVPRLLVSPPPPRPTGPAADIFYRAEARSAGLGALMKAAAERQRAAFVDAGTLISVEPVDGIHFDAGAHAALGRAIATELRQVVVGS